MKKTSLCLLIALFIGTSTSASADTLTRATPAQSKATYEKEIASYTRVFSGNNAEFQIEAAEALRWAGLSDERLFDVIEEKLITLAKSKTKGAQKQAAAYAMALGFSGNEKYEETLTQLASSTKSKVRKQAKSSISLLGQYRAWNAIISKDVESAETGKALEQRQINMLLSSDYILAKAAAIQVYEAKAKNKTVVAAVHQRVQNEYDTISDVSDDQKVDIMAWFIKILAQSRDSAHKPLLQEIAAKGKHKKIRKYAAKYVNNL